MILQVQDYIVRLLKEEMPDINIEKVPEKVGKTFTLNTNTVYVSYDGSRYDGEGNQYHGIREMRFNVQVVSKRLYGENSISEIGERILKALTGAEFNRFAFSPVSDDLSFYEPDIWVYSFVFKIKQPVLEVK